MFTHEGGIHKSKSSDSISPTRIPRHGSDYGYRWYSHKSCIDSYLFGNADDYIECKDCGGKYKTSNLKPWNLDDGMAPCESCGSIEPTSTPGDKFYFRNAKCWFCGFKIYSDFQEWDKSKIHKPKSVANTYQVRSYHEKCLSISKYKKFENSHKEEDKRKSYIEWVWDEYPLFFIFIFLVVVYSLIYIVGSATIF